MMSVCQLTISVLADRPDLAEAMWAMPNSWPEFMRHDPIGGLYYGNVETRFAEFVLVAQDDAGEVVACAHSIPFVLGDEALPDNGWDFVIRNGLLASLRGEEPDAISAVEIAVRPDRQGTGLSGQLLAAMRDNAARCGFAELVAPVRPNGKADVRRADGDLRVPGPRGRPAGGPVAAGARPGRRPHRAGGPALDGGPRHARGVARVDRPAVRRDRPGPRAPGTRPGALRRRARRRGVRRAQRVGRAPHRG